MSEIAGPFHVHRHPPKILDGIEEREKSLPVGFNAVNFCRVIFVTLLKTQECLIAASKSPGFLNRAGEACHLLNLFRH